MFHECDMVDFSFNAVHVSNGPTERVERRKKEKKIDEKKINMMLNMMLLLFGRCCTIDMQQKIALCHQFPVSPIFAYHFLALCRNSNTLANAEPYTYLWPPEMSYGNLNKKCAYVWPTIPSPSKTEDAHRTFRIRCTAVLFLFFFFILLTIAHCISCASGVICCDDLARVEGKKHASTVSIMP